MFYLYMKNLRNILKFTRSFITFPLLETINASTTRQVMSNMNWFKKKSNDQSDLEQKFSNSSDYKKVEFVNQKTNIGFQLAFISTLIDESILQESVLPYLL